MEIIRVFILFIFASFFSGDFARAETYKTLREFSTHYLNREILLEKCEEIATKKTTCDYNPKPGFSFFKVHPRLECQSDGSQLKVTSKRKWKACIRFVSQEFTEPVKLQLKLVPSEILQIEYCEDKYDTSYIKRVGLFYGLGPASRGRLSKLFFECLGDTNVNNQMEGSYKNKNKKYKGYLYSTCMDYFNMKSVGLAAIYYRSYVEKSCVSCVENHQNSYYDVPDTGTRKIEEFGRACPIAKGMIDSYRPISTKQENYFKGFKCKDDCSGHAAGYDWAKKNMIFSEETCYEIDRKNSRSFLEGCIAFSGEQ